MGKHHVIIEGHHCLLHLAFYGLVISSVARCLLSLTGMAAWLGTSHEIGGEPAHSRAECQKPAKIRFQKIREIDESYLCMQQFDKF